MGGTENEDTPGTGELGGSNEKTTGDTGGHTTKTEGLTANQNGATDSPATIDQGAADEQARLREENDGEDPDRFLTLSDVTAIGFAAQAGLRGALGEPAGLGSYADLTAPDKAVQNAITQRALGQAKPIDDEWPEDGPHQRANSDLFHAIVDALEQYMIAPEDGARGAE